MIDHLSPSSLKMYLRCPAQYEFRYMKGIKIPPAGVMVAGSAYHEALAHGFKTKMATKELPPVQDILDAFDTSWERQLREHAISEDEDEYEFDDIEWGDEDPGQLKDVSITLTRKYAVEMAPKIQPLAVENRMTLIQDGFNYVVIPDLVTDVAVVDHKLKARRFSQQDLDRDLQPTSYLWATDRPRFDYHVALKQKSPAIDVNTVERTTAQVDFLIRQIKDVWAAVKAGAFPCNDQGWHCSQDFCGYWNLCKLPT